MRPDPGRRSRLRVEPGLPEDEHADRGEELEPLGRPVTPQERPVDGVAVEERAENESEVDAEREPEDVERDEQDDADRPSHERREMASREEVETRRADVCGRERRGFLVGTFGRHRRSRHGADSTPGVRRPGRGRSRPSARLARSGAPQRPPCRDRGRCDAAREPSDRREAHDGGGRRAGRCRGSSRARAAGSGFGRIASRTSSPSE